MKLLVVLSGLIAMNQSTIAQPSLKLSQQLFDTYDRYKVPQITSRRFTQAQLFQWLEPLERKSVFSKETLGSSAEQRSIQLLKAGRGGRRVLLWSQMHGDESTATMALADIFSFFAEAPNHPVAQSILKNLTLLVIPMLNPDGAERFQRRTAQLIDMNRDALRLGTPEARILKTVHDRYRPDFGFNLHDQDPRSTVGQTKNVAAISLLAPATDEAKTDNAVRLRAKLVAARLVEILEQYIPQHVAKYDDTFEPRAFGDNIQKWGTSTVLIESGGWPNDPEKMFLRKMNFVGILSALFAIATDEYAQADIAAYERLALNGKNFYDLILRNIEFKSNDITPSITVDVGINFDEEADSVMNQFHLIGTVVDIGDLSTFGAFEEFDCTGTKLDTTMVAIDRTLRREEIDKLLHKK